MNGDGTADAARVPPGLVDAYEQLRPAATGSPRRAANLQGLGTLIRKGMAAWIQACAAVAPSARPPPSPVVDSVQMLPTVQRDVVDVLAAMALTITPEVRT